MKVVACILFVSLLHSTTCKAVNRRSVGAGASAYGKNPDLLFPMVNETTTMAPVTAVTPNNNIQSARLQELYKTLVCLNVGSSANGNDPDKKIDFGKNSMLPTYPTHIKDCFFNYNCHEKVDLVFLLDASGSVGIENFEKEKQFIIESSNQFIIGPNDAQVSVVMFSNQPHNQFNLSEFDNISSITNQINAIPYEAGGTYTSLALQFASDNSFTAEAGNRPDAIDVLVVVTDGKSTDHAQTLREAAALKQRNIVIVGVGIGSAVDAQELNGIATSPLYVMYANDFDALRHFYRDIHDISCIIEPVVTTPEPTRPNLDCHDKADLVFLLDASGSVGIDNFNKEKEFISNSLSRFIIGPNDTQVSVVMFSNQPVSQFNLSEYQDRESIVNETNSIPYQAGGTYTSSALAFTRDYSFTAPSGDRPDARNFLIVITDGKSTDPTQTLVEAANLKQNQIVIIGVGIGSGVDRTELSAIASGSQYVLHVDNFNSLSQFYGDIHQLACIADQTTPPPTTPEPTTTGSTPEPTTGEPTTTGSTPEPTTGGPGRVRGSTGPGVGTGSGVTVNPRNTGVGSGASAGEKSEELFPPVAATTTSAPTDPPNTNTNVDPARLAELYKSLGCLNVGSSATGINDNSINYIDFENGSPSSQGEQHRINCSVLLPACHDRVDLVFLLDASGSVELANFNKEKDFIAQSISRFFISPKDAQVSVVTFSNQPANAFNLNQYQNKASIVAGVNQIPYVAGGTYTSSALAYVRENSFTPGAGDRPDARNVLVVMTDGKSTDPMQTVLEAAKLKQSNITTIVLGIGSGVDQNELNTIASAPSYVLNVDDFDALRQVYGAIHEISCIIDQTTTPMPTTTPIPTTTQEPKTQQPTTQEPTTMEPTTMEPATQEPSTPVPTPVVCRDKADLVYLLDSSGSVGIGNFQKEQNFIAQSLSRFVIGPNDTQVSVAMFSNEPVSAFNLSDYQDKASIVNAVNNMTYIAGGTYTSSALAFVRDISFSSEAGGRSDARNVLVVITDGKSTDPAQTIKEAKTLHGTNISVIAVGIGSGVDKNELNVIASDPQYVLNVDDFDALRKIYGSVHELACKIINNVGAGTGSSVGMY
ncbi:Hypothetical predicted protein [Mytilus galloprovincialis]|uniref:VWFA domain-containing protein n=1 Tax=Mytilus galloprovincialis TaxID=29158 RepID=A0A8B6BV40_MYTGA|nr:Hypothetical predicted protein [Mytilus galloprovincialis]